MTSCLSSKILEAIAQEHESILGSKERRKLQLLHEYLLVGCVDDDDDDAGSKGGSKEEEATTTKAGIVNSIDDDDSSTNNNNLFRQDMARQVNDLLSLTQKLNKKIAKIRKGGFEQDRVAMQLERTEVLLDKLLKKRKELFVKGRSAVFLNTALREARHQPEQVEKRKEKKLRKQQEEQKRKEQRRLAKLQAEEARRQAEAAEAEAKRAEVEREKQVKIRRAMQAKLAGHPSAINLWFGKMRISEHALFRWNDRGISLWTLSDFLQKIDDGEFMYRLQPQDDESWEVRVSLPGRKEKIVLILNEHKSTVITVLRDDTYNHKGLDRNYAPAGRIAAEKETV